jgi:hypothetical protein
MRSDGTPIVIRNGVATELKQIPLIEKGEDTFNEAIRSSA